MGSKARVHKHHFGTRLGALRLCFCFVVFVNLNARLPRYEQPALIFNTITRQSFVSSVQKSMVKVVHRQLFSLKLASLLKGVCVCVCVCVCVRVVFTFNMHKQDAL